MNLRDKRFWLPILIAIPLGILINLVTQLLNVQFSFAIVVASGLLVCYFLLSERIANWRAERSRQSKDKAIKQLELEISEVERLRGDLPRLVSRIAWDLLLFQATLIIAVLFAATAVFVFPIILEERQFIIGALMGFIVGLWNLLRGLRYIRRVYDYEAYRDRVKVKLAKLAPPDWPELLVSRHWILVHNPPDQSKPITFLRDGAVGEGQNQNEHTWRVQNGRLELLQGDGRVHSRFDFNEKATRFIHTNDPDTLSNRNQYIHLF